MDKNFSDNFNLKNKPGSYWLKIIIIFILLLLVFQAGEYIGYRRAGFAGRLGENYYRTLGGGRHRNLFGTLFSDLPGDHSALGRIVAANTNTLVIAGTDNVEKTILLNPQTIIRQWQNNLTANDLKVGQTVIVLGEPNNQAQIVARLIRVIPNLMMMGAVNTASSTITQ